MSKFRLNQVGADLPFVHRFFLYDDQFDDILDHETYFADYVTTFNRENRYYDNLNVDGVFENCAPRFRTESEEVSDIFFLVLFR